MKPTTIDEYIELVPEASRDKLIEALNIIRKACPEAEEKISYGQPYFGYHGRLIYVGAYKNHLALYVMDAAKEAYKEEIKPYYISKATLHFPLDKPLDKTLITNLVKAQAKANKQKQTAN